MKIILIIFFIILSGCKEKKSSGDTGGLCNISSGGASCPLPQPPQQPVLPDFAIQYVDPPNGTNDFGTDESLTIEFNRPVSLSSLIYNSGNESLDNLVLKSSDGEVVQVSLSMDGQLLKIKPAFSLTPGKSYSLSLKNSITDQNGYSLTQNLQTSFTTDAKVGTNPGINPIVSWSNSPNESAGINVERFELFYGRTSRTNSAFTEYERRVEISTAGLAKDPVTNRYTMELADPLFPQRMYYFAMKACNSDGCSSYSSEASRMQP